MIWRHGKVPITCVGKRIEHWNEVDRGSWFRVIADVIDIDGEPAFSPTNMEGMKFAPSPPCPAELGQVWRIVSEDQQ